MGENKSKMKLLSLFVLAGIGNSEETDRAKYGVGDVNICNGVKLSNKMNHQNDLSFHCKPNKNKDQLITTCKVKCGNNAKGRNNDTPRKVFCVKVKEYGKETQRWAKKKGRAYDIKKFGCSDSYGANKNKDKKKNKENDKDGDKNKYKQPKPTTKPQKYTPKPTTKNPKYTPKPTTKKPKTTYKPPKKRSEDGEYVDYEEEAIF